MYIYKKPLWPHFSWDKELITDLLVQVRHTQGRLIGNMESIGFQLRVAALLQTLTQDIVKSSEIEGEILDKTMVRSSVARHLGIEDAATHKFDRNIEGVVEMMLDATQKFDKPLTKSRVLQWHASLFPTGYSGYSKIATGEWRKKPVQVVSGRVGKEKVHFEGPSVQVVDKEMQVFLGWINAKNGIDLVLKSAIAHLWFVTIHPFEDGNGRIGRAVADYLLAQSEFSPHRFYSLSSQIQTEGKKYYAILEKTQKGELDITPWIEWFLCCLGKAIDRSFATFNGVINKAKNWEKLSQIPLNQRQQKIINLLVDGFEGNLTTTKWAKITKTSQDSAYRDICDLLDKKILIKSPGQGRNTNYLLAVKL